MPVDTPHPDYPRALQRAELTADCVIGLDESNAARHVPQRKSEEDDAYKKRLTRGIYTNYTARTLAGLSGAVYRVAPQIELPDSLEYLKKNADGHGRGLTQLSKTIFKQVMCAGMRGLLVDFPKTEEGAATLEQKNRLQLHSYISGYNSKSVINFKTDRIGGRDLLSLVVLKEAKGSGPDEFSHDTKERYRVLRLTNGIYTQQLFDENKNPIGAEIAVTDHAGASFDHIPFYFIGSDENTPGYHDPVLYDIAVVNRGHFRNSVDHESNIAIHGGITLIFATSMSAEEFKQKNPNGVVVGENNGIHLEKGDTAELMQAAPAQILVEAMNRKEEQIRQIGAKVIERGGQAKTAEGARIDASSEHSVLDNVVSNISEGLSTAIADVARFEGVQLDSDEPAFSLNDDFWMNRMDPQEAMAMIQLRDVGAMRTIDIARNVQEGGWIAQEADLDEVLEQASIETGI